jgi:hypothetical protein
VHVSARRSGDEWEIICQDNGIGIEPEFADKVFVIFQRLHAKEAYPGTGIGLAIAKKIVEYHGGRVWVDLDASEGTTIRFTLPVVTYTGAGESDAPPGGEAGDVETVAVPAPGPQRDGSGSVHAGSAGRTDGETAEETGDMKEPAV